MHCSIRVRMENVERQPMVERPPERRNTLSESTMRTQPLHRPVDGNDDEEIDFPSLLVPARIAARLLSISERHLWSVSAPRGPLRTVRLGTRVLYDRSDLQR